MSTSECASPVSGLTLSDASVSGTDAEAMSGGLAFGGFEGAGSVSGLIGVVRIVNTLSGVFPLMDQGPNVRVVIVAPYNRLLKDGRFRGHSFIWRAWSSLWIAFTFRI